MSDTGETGRPRSVTVGPLTWPRPRSVALDAVVTAVAVAESALQGVLFADQTGLPLALVLPLAVVVGLTVVLRRRWPGAVVLVAVAVLPANMGTLHALVGLYTLARLHASRRLVGSLSGLVIICSGIVMYTTMSDGAQGATHPLPWWFLLLVAAMFGLLHAIPPVLLGMYVGARRRLVESLRERADGLERELSLLADRAEERAEWARREERTRIARDMHDVVAHRVSLMVVHAAALQAVVLKDPEKASANAALVGDMGRQALTELRTMLGVMRSHESSAITPEGPDPATRLAEIAASASGPRLRELRDLIDQSRTAGITVAFAEDGDRIGYAPHVERTAYRVVQEALTNVHKHAPGAVTTVRLARREDEVAVRVENDPPPSRLPDAPPPAVLPSGGNGLVGMRERVTSLGGGFVSGHTPQGGFRVSAVIPDPRDATDDTVPAAASTAASRAPADSAPVDGSPVDSASVALPRAAALAGVAAAGEAAAGPAAHEGETVPPAAVPDQEDVAKARKQ